MSKIIAKTFIHSCYVSHTKDGDAVSVCEHIYYDDGRIEPNLRVVVNPKRTFYITKKHLQALQTDKKEREHINNLDRFVCPNRSLIQNAYTKLTGKPPIKSPKGWKIMNEFVKTSPYLYAGGLSIESLIKIKYAKDFEKTGLELAPVTSGMLDIEISINPETEGQLLCYTLTHENKIYTAINKSWMKRFRNGNHEEITLEEIKQLSEKTILPLLEKAFKDNKNLELVKDKLPLEFHYFVSDDEVEMIKWGFSKAHENQTIFIGGWNINYDVSQLMRILKENKVPYTDIFSHPSVPPQYRYFNFREDYKKVNHPTEKWHWYSSTSMFQFIDLMCLYRRLRTVEGLEYSYKLDYILNKNGLGGKVHWDELEDVNRYEGTADWHRKMAKGHFAEYVIYNQWDSISLQLLEWLNNDETALRILSGYTPIEKFPRQTIKIQDILFAEWKDKGWIIGTSSPDMEEEEDEELLNKGGAVLDMLRIENCGIKLFKENPTFRSRIHTFVSDTDFSQMYPTVMVCGNISGETRISTAINVIGDHIKIHPESMVELLHSYLISIKDNAYNLGVDYLNLPTYQSMLEKYHEHTRK